MVTTYSLISKDYRFLFVDSEVSAEKNIKIKTDKNDFTLKVVFTYKMYSVGKIRDMVSGADFLQSL